MDAEPLKIDKSKWGPGPWQDEPDRIDFEHAGLPCLMLRGPRHGAWCGYVAVPPSHPMHGKPDDDLDVRVHGGLSFADKCGGQICHVPKPGEPDNVWWFGFDCLHGCDIAPGFDLPIFGAAEYRDVVYVRAEVEHLAEQLATHT